MLACSNLSTVLLVNRIINKMVLANVPFENEPSTEYKSKTLSHNSLIGARRSISRFACSHEVSVSCFDFNRPFVGALVFRRLQFNDVNSHG